MNKSIFKPSSNYLAASCIFPALMCVQLAKIASRQSADDWTSLASILLVITLLSLLIPFYVRGLALIITDSGIEMFDSWFNLYSYKFAWTDVTGAAILNNGQTVQVVLTTSRGKKDLITSLWSLNTSTLPIRDKANGWFALKRAPEDRALFQLIKHYRPEAETLWGQEARKYVLLSQDVDLGKKAGIVAFASIVMAFAGAAGLFLSDAKRLENDLLWMYMAPIGIAAFVYVFVELKDKTRLAAACLLALLFPVCLGCLLISAAHIYADNWGSQTKAGYILVESGREYQRWHADPAELPDIEIFSKPGNLKYTITGTKRDFTIMNGPFGVRDVPRDEIQAVFIKGQHTGLRL